MVTSTLHVINNLSWRVWMAPSQCSDFRTNSESTLPQDFESLGWKGTHNDDIRKELEVSSAGCYNM